MGFPAALLLLFVGLKLGGVLTWSWFWVLSPIWILPLVFVVASMVVFLVCLIIVHFFS